MGFIDERVDFYIYTFKTKENKIATALVNCNSCLGDIDEGLKSLPEGFKDVIHRGSVSMYEHDFNGSLTFVKTAAIFINE